MPKWFDGNLTFVRFAVEESIAFITLDRPERRNALSRELIASLGSALREADDRKDVRVVILQANGPDFCSGYDLQEGYSGSAENGRDQPEYRSRETGYDDDLWSMSEMLAPIWSISDMHKPVLAKVHGRALAGGAELALACDIVIAADDALIGHPGVRGLGSPPVNNWLYHVGPQWAKRLLLTGDNITGRDAAKIGLVLDAVSMEELDDEVRTLAKRMALIDPGILATNKRAVNLGLDLAGARVFQRLAVELDARAHAAGKEFEAEWRTAVEHHGLKEAIRQRDLKFLPGTVTLKSRG